MNAATIAQLAQKNVGFGKNPIELLVMGELDRRAKKVQEDRRKEAALFTQYRRMTERFLEESFKDLRFTDLRGVYAKDFHQSKWAGTWEVLGHQVNYLMVVTLHSDSDPALGCTAMLHLSGEAIEADVSDLPSKAVENTAEAVAFIASFIEEQKRNERG